MATRKENRLALDVRSDNVMRALRIGTTLVGFAIFCIMLTKIITYKPDPRTEAFYRPAKDTLTITPSRGDILDCKGRILATTAVVYDVHLDCRVAADTLWNGNIAALSRSLAETLPARNADQWQEYLKQGRSSKAGFLKIASSADQMTVNRLRAMPIFCKGRFKGGYLEGRKETRMYPYGDIASRTLGFIKDPSLSRYNKVGIEGNYDSCLHGRDGKQVMRVSDFGKVPVKDSKNIKATSGLDVRTTLDIDVQTIADEALRRKISGNDLIDKACVIVLETATGAVRAMVNLGQKKDGSFEEINNYALMMAECPGSVFKGVSLMAALEDGYVTSLEQEIPTWGGMWKYNGMLYDDTKHLGRKRFPSGKVQVREAFEMSANNTFRQIVCDNYGSKPSRFVDKVKSFGIIDTIDFDLKGATPPFILDPSMKKASAKGSWDGGTLPRMAIGYCMEVSALNLVTFYNAIANNGRMMKPYLIEAIEENGRAKQKFHPSVMRRQICGQATVDTLKKVMGRVTQEKGGTAYWQLHDAVCPIAGKTGTAQRLFEGKNGRMTYREDGKESQQATFVGFFPSNKPVYTAIVVIWGKPSVRNFFGASYSAPVFKEIADKIYCLNEY